MAAVLDLMRSRNPTDAKRELRAQLRSRRAGLTPQENARRAQLLTTHLSQVINPQSILAGFWPMPGEPDLRPLMRTHAANGGTVVLPVTDPRGSRRLIWAQWLPETTMVEHPQLPFLQPDSAQTQLLQVIAQQAAENERSLTVLVPALAIAADGHRLGQGGGYYDTTLAALQSPDFDGVVELIAVVHAEEVLPESTVPTEDHDLRIERVCTERGVWKL